MLATTWWSALQDMSPEPLFGLLTHRQTDRQALKTILAFAIEAGN